MLPGLDGLAIVKALRAAEISVPVLILSALAHVDERVTGLRAGGDDYLSKPFAFSELHARLERSEEHTSELQSLMRISYAVFCLNKNKDITHSYLVEKDVPSHLRSSPQN